MVGICGVGKVYCITGIRCISNTIVASGGWFLVEGDFDFVLSSPFVACGKGRYGCVLLVCE